MEVPLTEMNHVLQHLVEKPEKNIYQEYFEYAQEHLSIQQPSSWQEALALFKAMIQIAE
jgi:hypothetical protein